MNYLDKTGLAKLWAKINAKFISKETDPTVPKYVKSITEEDIEKWNSGTGGASGDTTPIGGLLLFGGTTAPTNWLIADGSAVSRTEYSELFAVYGTTYGSGDGSTTFNLPDFRDRVPVGLNVNTSYFNSLGKKGGESTHKLTVNEIPSHEHNINASGIGRLYWNNSKYQVGTSSGGINNYSENRINILAAATGGDQGHNNLQPYIVTNFIIKAKNSVGLVGNIVNDINATGDNDVPNAKTVKEYVEGYVLYTGNAVDNFTLTDDVKNYKYLEFFYSKGYSSSSVKVAVEQGKATMMAGFVNNDTFLQVTIRNILFSGKNVTNRYSGGVNLGEPSSADIYTNNEIAINKVIGYK